MPISRLTLTACLAAALPLAAPAQEALLFDMCLEGPSGSAPQDLEALGTFLSGSWAMVAPGTGFTLGANHETVTLGYDPASGTIRMRGAAGPSIALIPVGTRLREDGTLEAAEPGFDVSIEALTPGKLTARDLELVGLCRAPQRFWWTFGSGTRRSWGALMFYDNDNAVGFMANSAGGTRHVQLQRM